MHAADPERLSYVKARPRKGQNLVPLACDKPVTIAMWKARICFAFPNWMGIILKNIYGQRYPNEPMRIVLLWINKRSFHIH